MGMIGGRSGPAPGFLRQYELGKVPAEMARENDEGPEPHDDGPRKDGKRRWWRRLFRRH
jgi:hypothetical protein